MSRRKQTVYPFTIAEAIRGSRTSIMLRDSVPEFGQ
jgi:hypothetical protein